MRFSSAVISSHFNPRSHEGSDSDFCGKFTEYNISIHAPTRGATKDKQIQILADLFQSTLPRGERRRCLPQRIPCLYFNPRSHEGSDAVFLSDNPVDFRFQSTLPRGERLNRPSGFDKPFAFQSTLPRGERLIITVLTKHISKFQSTLPRGERP